MACPSPVVCAPAHPPPIARPPAPATVIHRAAFVLWVWASACTCCNVSSGKWRVGPQSKVGSSGGSRLARCIGTAVGPEWHRECFPRAKARVRRTPLAVHQHIPPLLLGSKRCGASQHLGYALVPRSSRAINQLSMKRNMLASPKVGPAPPVRLNNFNPRGTPAESPAAALLSCCRRLRSFRWRLRWG